MGAIIEESKALGSSLEQSERQLNTELARKSKTKPVQAKIEQFTSDIKEFKANHEVLVSFMEDIFARIFNHRYRDVEAHIRQLCLSTLGIFQIFDFAKNLLDCICVR